MPGGRWCPGFRNYFSWKMKTCAKDKSLFCKNKNFAKKTKVVFQPVRGAKKTANGQKQFPNGQNLALESIMPGMLFGCAKE